MSGETFVRVPCGTTARLRSFLKGPRKAVAFFTQHHELLAHGLLMPDDYERMIDVEKIVTKDPPLRSLFKRLFGTGLTYASELETIPL